MHCLTPLLWGLTPDLHLSPRPIMRCPFTYKTEGQCGVRYFRPNGRQLRLETTYCHVDVIADVRGVGIVQIDLTKYRPNVRRSIMIDPSTNEVRFVKCEAIYMMPHAYWRDQYIDIRYCVGYYYHTADRLASFMTDNYSLSGPHASIAAYRFGKNCSGRI